MTSRYHTTHPLAGDRGRESREPMRPGPTARSLDQHEPPSVSAPLSAAGQVLVEARAGGIQLAALILLVLLQLAASWLSVRSAPIRRMLKSESTALVRDGHLCSHVMRSQRVTAGEVRQAIRSQGIGDISAVAAVILETDGSFSVIPVAQAGDLSALQGLAEPSRERH